MILPKIRDKFALVPSEDGVYPARIDATAHKKYPHRIGAAHKDYDNWRKKETWQFLGRAWQCQPPVTADQVTGIKADYKKDRVQVEVQFGNMARWYTDVFKFQVSYSLDLIDVGVLVIPMQGFASTIDENVAYYERVMRELPYAKMSITLPIWVIGIKP